ncbi:MAG: metallophosphoesterase, partial [Eudoraea sp.]
MLRWIVFIIIYFILGFYTLQALKTATRFPWVYFVFVAMSLIVLGNFIFQFTWGETDGRVLSRPKSYAFGFLAAILTFKIITIIFLFS